MDGPGGPYVKQNKQDTERQVPCYPTNLCKVRNTSHSKTEWNSGH
jgi:hypothetical protein